MAVDDADLLHGIETGFFIYPPIPGLVDEVQIPGLLGRSTSLSHPLVNLVGDAHLTAENADGVIAQVYDHFASDGRSFGWIVGPSTTPADLRDRLERAGLQKIDELAGMVLTDLGTPIGTNSDVRIEEIDPSDAEPATDVMARSYGMPQDVAEFFARALAVPVGGPRIRPYLAYLSESADPVAFSILAYLSSSVVLLGGAATLPDLRGRGIYSTLVARRLADARADGAEAAVIQAVRSTSAPICARLGFREICGLDFYAWLPEGMSEGHEG